MTRTLALYSPAEKVILCVEDDARLRADLVDELVAAGYVAYAAQNGEDALSRLNVVKPDLILCDITMPVMGGYDFLRELRSRRPDLDDVPFVFLSVLNDKRDIVQGKRLGADDYLLKPVDYDVLLATISSRLNQVIRMRRNMIIKLDQERRDVVEPMIAESHSAFASLANALDSMANGVILLDGAGRVQHINKTAKLITGSDDGLIVSGSSIRTTNQSSTRGLRRAIQDILSGQIRSEVLTVPRQVQRPIVLQIFSLAAGASETSPAIAILLTDPELKPKLSTEMISRMYESTPAEARLAVALTEGKRLDDIATEFGISPTTVSYHLQNLFRKTHTSRQADLIALLIRGAISFQPDDSGPTNCDNLLS